MSNDSRNRPSTPGRDEEEIPYRVYRSGRDERSAEQSRPYRTYRSTPKGLRERLRGEQESVEEDERLGMGRGARGGGSGRGGGSERGGWGRGGGADGSDDRAGRRRLGGKAITPWRVVRWVVGVIVAWVLLSVVLFFISAETKTGRLPAGAKTQLSSAGPMLTSPNTVLILGLDNRPTSGPGSKEGGLQSYNFAEKDANTDSIMLWRIGGGTSRRLSIPRDTLVNIPGVGESKINAAWSAGGPALTLKVIKQLTGIQINHVIVVDLANFPKFINDVGGVTVKTGRICSQISGGKADGGFTLNLKPGSHHLSGEQALILARTRENSCDPAYDDLNREAAQQRIVNSIKSQLLTPHTFLHLPWVAWDAPGVVQTDMGGLSLLQLFVASEIGGSAPPELLKESVSTYNGADVLIPNAANVHAAVRRLMTGH